MSSNEAEIPSKCAKAFLENAERLIEEGVYDLAAFNIEQECQLILKYKLLIKTGTYPRTYSILGLLRLLSEISEDIKPFIADTHNIVISRRLKMPI